MTDLHEANFKWPAGPSKVIVTGDFDDWKHSTELTKGKDGFTGSFHLPWGGKSSYKYVVDGQWTTNPDEPSETDGSGNLNNVYTSPPHPKTSVPAPDMSPAGSTGASPASAAKAAATTIDMPPLSPAADEPVAPPHVAEKTSMEGVKDNAASIVSYVASGLGAAFASVTGIDPINPQQIPIEDDKAQEILAAKSVPKAEPTTTAPAPTVAMPQPKVAAPIEESKPMADALAPIVDEPVVLNLLPTTSSITQTASSAATTVKANVPTSVAEVKVLASTAATTVQANVPTSVAEVQALTSTAATAIAAKLPEPVVAAAVKVQETIAPSTVASGTGTGTTATGAGIPVPNAPEPYKEPVVTEPVAVPDAVEPYKETNGTLPGETATAPSKVSEAAEKVKETVVAPSADAATSTGAKASAVVDKVKDTVASSTTTTTAAGEKHSFPAASEAGHSVTSTAVDGSGADGTSKRKKRHSIFGKLKEVFTPEKQKKTKVGSTAS